MKGQEGLLCARYTKFLETFILDRETYKPNLLNKLRIYETEYEKVNY